MRRRIVLLAWTLPIIIIGGLLLCWEVFKVRLLVVTGCEKRPVAEVSQLSGIVYEQSLFLLFPHKVEERINACPYYEVEDIGVTLPSTVHVTVRERQACGILKTTGGILLLDEEGYVLENRASQDRLQLPLLSGLTVNAYPIGEQITTGLPMQLTALKLVLGELAKQDMLGEVEEINFSSVNDILLFSSEGLSVELGNTGNLENKIRFLHAVLDDLRSKGIYQGLINLSSGNSATYSKDIYVPGEAFALPTPIPDAGQDGTVPTLPDTDEPAATQSEEQPSQATPTPDALPVFPNDTLPLPSASDAP